MKLSSDLLSLKAWQWRVSRRVRPWVRGNWPLKAESVARPPRIAIVTVNYNTRELLARLVFSLRRIVSDDVRVGPIVVVDNNSTDGSVELIAALADAGVVHAVLNKRQAYHGPGLNQGMEFLRGGAQAGKHGFADIDYVFVVDSDVFICRGEVFTHAIQAMKTVGSSMAGEFEANEYIPGGYAHVSSLLFDPATSWRRGFHPFEEHGVPALEYQRTVLKRGLVRLDFPFRSHFYLVHLWSGTLKAICSSQERDNKYHDWAAADLATRSAMDRNTEYVVDEFEQCYREQTGATAVSAIVKACSTGPRIRLKRPYEVVTSPSYTPSGIVTADGNVAR